jgi:hypothetical protein
MTRFTLAGALAVGLIAFSLPAAAQMNNGTASKPAMAGDTMTATCQGMMDKAHPMMDSMSDGRKKTMAMKQMNMANTAMSAGKEKTCMSHMKMAMHDMM